jgi:hypothetical protein
VMQHKWQLIDNCRTQHAARSTQHAGGI